MSLRLLELIETLIIWFEKIIMFLAMMIMVVSLSMQVFFRYVIPVSIPWTEELSIIAFIFMIFNGAALAAKYERHLGISNIVDMLPEYAYIILWYVKKILIMLFLLNVLVYKAYPMVIQGFSNTFTMIEIPVFYVMVQIPLFGIFVVYHTFLSMLKKEYREDLESRMEPKVGN